MFFDERSEGDYRIHAGAMEAPRGRGYIAAVVVSRRQASSGHLHEVFRDDGLHCNHRWPSPEAALSQAVNRARQVITQRREQQAARDLVRHREELEAAAEQD